MRIQLHTLLLVLVMLVVSVMPLQAADQEHTVEYSIKAAYLLNFTRFIEWPPEARNSNNKEINICLLGKDPFKSALDAIAGKTVRGQKLRIRRHRSIAKLQGCHVVFISNSENGRIGRILMELRKRPVLTVGETSNFNQLGGIIQFNLVNQKVRFNINPDAAKRARLSISSKLLNLATIVRESRP